MIIKYDHPLHKIKPLSVQKNKKSYHSNLEVLSYHENEIAIGFCAYLETVDGQKNLIWPRAS